MNVWALTAEKKPEDFAEDAENKLNYGTYQENESKVILVMATSWPVTIETLPAAPRRVILGR
jgi:hypothetical protein